MQQEGTITITVFIDGDNNKHFVIQADNDDVLPVTYVIEDVLKLY